MGNAARSRFICGTLAPTAVPHLSQDTRTTSSLPQIRPALVGAAAGMAEVGTAADGAVAVGGGGWGGVGLGIGTGLLLAAAVSAPYYGQFQQRLAGTESRGPRSPGIGAITWRLK